MLAKRYRQKAVELADAEARIGELRRKAAEVNREIEVLRAKRKSIDRGLVSPHSKRDCFCRPFCRWRSGGIIAATTTAALVLLSMLILSS